MPSGTPERRLAAILSADVVGYSRLMSQDEEATVRTLGTYREQIETLVAEYRGRLADFTGDSFLAEFPTALEAVRAAVATQRVLAARNADLPPDRRLEFRIGIHLGDVRVEGERLYGDGVNIAARLEGIAEPAGICISQAVHEQVEHRLALRYEDLGERLLKNIPRPVHAYGVRLTPVASAPPAPRRGAPWVAITAAAVILSGLGIAAWRAGWPGSDSRGTVAGPARIESLAVLPLANLSGDPAQEYFADGMTEALIADLAKIRALRVISRTSVMQYKDARKPLPEIAHELRVDGVVEGSVLRAGGRVRIVAQLIHAPTDRHLWSGTYERDLDDVIALQKGVAQAIVREIELTLTPQEASHLARAPRVRPEAYEAYLKGRHYWRRFLADRGTKAYEQAVVQFERAIGLDPSSALGYAGLAAVYDTAGVYGMIAPGEAARRIEGAVSQALERDDTLAEAHTSRGDLHWWRWEWDEVEREYRRAIELDPNYSTVHAWYAYFLVAGGRVEEGLAEIEIARRLDPLSAVAAVDACWVYLIARRLDQAEGYCRDALRIDPASATAHGVLSAVHSLQGRHEEALSAAHTAVELTEGGDIETRWLAYAHARAGNRSRASELLADLLRRSEERYLDPALVAVVYAGLGDTEKTFEWLEKAFEARSFELSWSSTLGIYDGVRGDARFQSLVRRIGRASGPGRTAG